MDRNEQENLFDAQTFNKYPNWSKMLVISSFTIYFPLWLHIVYILLKHQKAFKFQKSCKNKSDFSQT